MKKLIITLLLFTIILIMNQYNVNAAVKTKKCQKNLTLNNINLSNIKNYINSVDKKVLKLCTQDFCDYYKYNNQDDSINAFVQSYYNYLSINYNEEIAIMNTKKDINFTNLIIFSC